MSQFVLTDTDHGIWVEQFEQNLDHASIRKRTLRGGLSDGVDVVEVNNGNLSFTVLPTRGMGLWRGQFQGVRLGWDAPIHGPVHPQFVNQSDRGGLGWLTGFDEWLCRCGLNWNGPPGDDNGRQLTLHGRIANSPAYFVHVNLEDSQLVVHGEVEEAGLFYNRLRLSTTYATQIGSNRLEIQDEVTNLGAVPAEMQLLYHCNFGPPLLSATSRIVVPVAQIWPMTKWAADGLNHWNQFGPPTAGFVEQVYCMEPLADNIGNSMAVLIGEDCGAVLRWPIARLPCFTMWKNTSAIEDGYVTGLEPATNFPRFKSRERAAGRIVSLSPGQSWSATWSIEITDQSKSIEQWVNEVDEMQSTRKPQFNASPLAD